MLQWSNLRSGWPALLALVVGFGAMVPFMDTGLIVGPAAKAMDGADISFVVGFVVAAAVYYPLRKVAAHPTMGSPGVDDDRYQVEEESAAPLGI
jgi:purine-cytosine permease-like protein